MPRLKTLTPRVQGMAPRLQSIQSGSWRTTSQSSTARGYDYRWQQMREKHLAAHPFCVRCLAEDGIRATSPASIVVECAARGIAAPYGNVVDHIVPHRGDRELLRDPNNLQTLCATHHSGEKQREENRSA